MFEIEKRFAVDYLRAAGLGKAHIDALRRIGYFEAPASKGHHLACEGGLVKHSINVVGNLRLLDVFEEDKSACLVGMLHDLVKCRCYAKDGGDGYKWVQPPYPGHGVASVMIAVELGISLTPEEMAAITWHMGAFGLGEKELKAYGAAARRFPAIILTHAADHLASVEEDKGEVRGE